MAATAQNLKRLVRFLATMPPATDNHRNQIRVNIFSAAGTVPCCDRTFSVDAHFFNSYKNRWTLKSRPDQDGLETTLTLIRCIIAKLLTDRASKTPINRRARTESNSPRSLIEYLQFRACGEVLLLSVRKLGALASQFPLSA